ncbi:uncharacterized protein LOC132701732 [Cylas formicarius]|uniref:uncharacterized protein LOC132701732 n=1 Tax=Cylas formicarius TaxID=197179 RepID=UPI002958547D|nr:uncharacterized protein LOC132701732 [Cylas formicarius]
MWEFVLTAVISVPLVMSLAMCLCWNRKNPKNEWLGVDGMVTQKNPDENVNHLPSSTSFVNSGADKRNTATNTRRSLPDIPASMSATVTWAVNGDNSSEHYATLGQYQNAVKSNGEVVASATRPSISQQSSVSQADQFSPYERVKYDKIKSKEHPYAQVQSTSRHASYDEHDMTVEERVNLLRIDAASSSNEQSARSRRSSAHSSVGLDIPAATAVAGGVAASPDLPYMTPPVTQANFSGDSQESSKGYTSISVREPLANIIGQKNDPKRELDVHYSTVSDDSDDVYTTIADPNQIYTSESETYARINPMSVAHEVEVHHQPNDSSSSQELYEPPPHPVPPSVDSLKHVTHSRQASSSSSVANIGSPKPEKRQANSPLPPPPSINVELHSASHNLDDLYAKVHKNSKKDEHEEKNNAEETEEAKLSREHNYETLKKIARNVSDPGYEKIKGGADCEPGYASINGPESIASSDPGYEVLRDRMPASEAHSKVKSVLNDGYSVVNKKKPPPTMSAYDGEVNEPNYTTVESNGSDTDPNYESVHQNDPNYESVKDLELPYEQLENSRTSSDISGYEKIKGKNSSDSSNSESRTTEEPPYERLNNDTEVPGYEKVGGGGASELATDILNIHDENAIFQV